MNKIKNKIKETKEELTLTTNKHYKELVKLVWALEVDGLHDQAETLRDFTKSFVDSLKKGK